MNNLQSLIRTISQNMGIRVLVAVFTLLSAVTANSINLPPGFILETYADGMNRPIEMQWTVDGKLFVAAKSGKVYVIDADGVRLPTLFIDLRDEVNGFADRGLLAMALHPDFPATPWVFLGYTYDPPETIGQTGLAAPDGDGQRVSRVIRVSADPATDFNTAIAGSELVLLGTNSTWANIGDPAVDQEDLTADWSCGPDGAYIEDCLPAEGLSHSMGTLAFGSDGSLYVSYGDAGTWTTVDIRGTRAIDPDSLAGKILRINPDNGEGYADNPFVELDPETSEPILTSNRAKVWHLGLRNPYRFTIDPSTDELWIGDVGWNRWEELNHSATAGANFGWPCYEGGSGTLSEQGGYSALGVCQDLYTAGNVTAAIYAYSHIEGIGGAIIAGDFYDQLDWPAEYQGALFFADFSFEEINYAHLGPDDAIDIHSLATDVRLVDITVGPDGNLYLAKISDDSIDRIVYGEPTNLPVTGFSTGFNGATPTPAAGWAYLWNATAILGDSTGYASLLWDGVSLFDSDGVVGLPDATAMGNGHIGNGIMHPGKSVVGEGKLFNRYAIAEYTVAEDGYYSITNSSVSNTCAAGDGVEVITMVDDIILPGSQVGVFVAGNLDRNLGYLVAGSRIAVALGPNDGYACDDTAIDWDITFVAGTVPTGSAPTATIITPLPTDIWVVGDSVNFSGSATDPEDGPLTGDSLFWEIILHHNTHEHFDAGTASGETGSFSFPDHGANTYAELCLTATDSDSRMDTVCIDVRPQTVDYSFDSVPGGLELTFNSAKYTTPFIIEKLAINSERFISAESLQGQYQFDNWSIGGDLTQQIIIGDIDLTVTANYNDLGSLPLVYNQRVLASADDVEERSDGLTKLNGNDLELGDAEHDGLPQLVGLRYTGVSVPQGAQIIEAYIQFTTDDDTTSEYTSLAIQGQFVGDAPAFVSATNNVSDRLRTTASVAWEPDPWPVMGERGYAQRTPDIAPVISEIVDGDEWVSGNSLALIVSGTGQRTAMSYERWNSNAARLHISYIAPVVPLDIRIDVIPLDPSNKLDPSLGGNIPVVYYSSPQFDAMQANPATFKFGVNEASPINQPFFYDLDKQYGQDGGIIFMVLAAGITCGDTEVTLVGETFAGEPFTGTDSLDTSECELGCHP